jgi:non-ribosomal peptide synthetase component E (peptide arylation enzyme)
VPGGSADERAASRQAQAAAYRSAGLWDDATLADRVARHAAERPTALAVVDADGRYDYRELHQASCRLAADLRGRGIGASDVVSVQLPNRFEAAVTAVAVQSLGAVINPLLPGYRERELAHVFSVAAPKAIFTPAHYRGFDHVRLIADVRSLTGCDAWHVVVGAGEGTETEGGRRFEDALLAAALEAPEAVDASAISEVIFTSGTEAAPKAVLHSEQTANFSVRAAYADMGLTSQDVVWMPSPVGHSTGFNYGLRMALYHGLPLVLQDRWSPDDAIALVAKWGCSYTLAATTFLQDLVDRAREERRDLSSLRCFGCGGAPVPADLVRAAAEVGIGVRRLYGSTEVLVATWNRSDAPWEKRVETDGSAISNVAVELRGEDGSPIACGQPGEIFVRGPNTCVGFLDDEEREARTISPDGWVRSGDLAVMDADGYLTVVGRSKDIIIRGGLNIAPREVEDLLLGFEEIDRVAIVGLPDPRLGERCCACVVASPGAKIDLETIVARLRDAGLATHKLPERLELFDSLPTTASGKIQKFRIVELLGEREHPGGRDGGAG